MQKLNESFPRDWNWRGSCGNLVLSSGLVWLWLLFVLPGSSTWWPCSSCSECVSTRPGAELKPRASAQVWAVTLKNRCPNLEADPLLITGTVKRRPAGVLQEGRPHKLLLQIFVPHLSMSALIRPHRSRTTSEPFRTSTATTPTSAWRCDTACATGTWRCSGGCITTSTPTPPSAPTLWGEAPPVQVSVAKLCLNRSCAIRWSGSVASLFTSPTKWL